MRETWQAYLAAGLFTVGAIIAASNAIRFRRGGLRQLAAKYWDPTYPWYIRNVAFMQVPGAIGMGALAGIGWVAPTALATRSPPLVILGMACMLALGIAALLAALWWRRPPTFLKPDWLRQEETLHGPPASGAGWISWFDRVVTATMVIVVIALLLGPIVYVVLSLMMGETT